MPIIRIIAFLFGAFMVALGMLWIGQGTGLVMWPAESFMLAERAWAFRGVVLAAAGGIVIWLSLRSGHKS